MFSSSRSALPVGSIPIARSTLRIGQATKRHEIGFNTLSLWESAGNGRRFCGGLASLDVQLSPGIDTYSHTQRVRKIMCVIPTVSASRRTQPRGGLRSMSALRQPNFLHPSFVKAR
jgi:hypothetical protein